jgi:hypothetical protein
MPGEDPEGPWLLLAEAGRRTGRHPDTLRAMIRRGRLNGRKSNSGAWLVQLSPRTVSGSDPEGRPNGSGGGPEGDPDGPDIRPDIDPEELALLRQGLVQASTRAARAEGELAGLREALTRADAALAHANAELALARKGWLERLLEAVRRR